jgi:hypothetical protein
MVLLPALAHFLLEPSTSVNDLTAEAFAARSSAV